MEKPGYIAYFTMDTDPREKQTNSSPGARQDGGRAAEASVQTVAVTLLHRRGNGGPHPSSVPTELQRQYEWPAFELAERVKSHCWIEIEGREVEICALKHEVKDTSGRIVPVLFLDTNIPRNADRDRAITDYHENGSDHHRFCQEAVLSIGGLRMLRTLGYSRIKRIQMHEDGADSGSNPV